MQAYSASADAQHRERDVAMFQRQIDDFYHSIQQTDVRTLDVDHKMQPNNPFSTTNSVLFFAGSDSSTMHCVCDKTVVNVQAHSFELCPEALLNMQACSPRLQSTPIDHASMFGGYQCATLSNHASMFGLCCYTKPRRARDHHDPAPNRLLSHSFQRIDIQHWT